METNWALGRVGANHGSIHDTDLAVPLILAGGRIVAGESTADVSNVNLAATVAEFLGFPVAGTANALPGVSYK